MNILYIAYLNTNIAAGPNWSVPARVVAQSKIDNVLLINTANMVMDHFRTVKAYHNAEEFGELHLNNLPSPFNKPDIVVFEGFNFYEHVKFAKELRKSNVPYIITPRGALTYEAQHNHAWLKKLIARTLFQNSYIRNAIAIQYLTEGERDSSMRMFKTKNFILPNGFHDPGEKKTYFSETCINATFIGRLDIHHKGIDLLLNAIRADLPELQKANFRLSIYGPKRYDYFKIEKMIKDKQIEEVVELKDEVGGDRKKEVLLNTDIFIMTSRLEGLPMGLLEALAYGVPCFVSEGTNMRKAIDSADAGWTCETTEESIRIVLHKILKEKKELPKKSINALELSKNYQWDTIAKHFHETLELILKS